MHPAGYIGRFAPSPSGPLHAGSLVTALASYLDARAHDGQWRLRIEDVDIPRSVPGADRCILHQLRQLGMYWDGPVVWQSHRGTLYARAAAQLHTQSRLYGCRCPRRMLPAGPYPGTCRPAPGQPGLELDRARAWRFRVAPGPYRFVDRNLGPQRQDVARDVGDFIIRRADGLWAYQLAVVIDDGAQAITHVVRGADLLDSTARQIQLAHALGLPTPDWLHVPLVYDACGRKLSKQNHAPAVDVHAPLMCLQQAWRSLGFAPLAAQTPDTFLRTATHHWAQRFALEKRTA